MTFYLSHTLTQRLATTPVKHSFMFADGDLRSGGPITVLSYCHEKVEVSMSYITNTRLAVISALLS